MMEAAPRLRSLYATLAFFLGIMLVVVIYLPGVSGPYVFDDAPNLLDNDYIKIKNLDSQSLYDAAFVMNAGPLRRPVSMLTFTLNYYFAGNLKDPTPLKATNIAIHAVNTILVFLFLRLVFNRLSTVYADRWAWLSQKPIRLALLAGGTALLWAVAPIQLTSVLYVVQRMTSLSALFTFMALIFYMKGRLALIAGQAYGKWALGLGMTVSFALAMLSKENAAVFPLLILLLEVTLFPNESPWRFWGRLSDGRKRLLLAAVIIMVSAISAGIIHHALTSYGSRPFTPMERVLTEARVLWLYLYLILVPNTTQFGLNHDDIELSTSLLSPWTTLPALLGILTLIALGVAYWRKSPLLGLGILWFFTGHVLESSIFALEIAHEHRNYLPSLGVFLVVVYLFNEIRHRGYGKCWYILALFATVFVGVTALRSSQWSDAYTFGKFEALHHPNSARAHTYLGWAQAQLGMYADALESTRQAARLDPNDAAYFVNMHLIMVRSGIALTEQERTETLTRLTTHPVTASTLLALHNIDICLDRSCGGMAEFIEQWTQAMLDHPPPGGNDFSYYFYLLGRSLSVQGKTDRAISAYYRAHEADPAYLHPLFAITGIYIGNRNINDAEQVLAKLRDANEQAPYRRDAEIAILAEKISQLKNQPRPVTVDHQGMTRRPSGNE